MPKQNLKKRIFNKIFEVLYSDRASAPLTKAPHINVPLYASETRAGNIWDVFLQDILTELKNNPYTFLRQPKISVTVHPNSYDLCENYFNEMVGNGFFSETLFPRLNDPPMGNPYMCPFFPLASPHTIQMNYYLYLIEKHFGFHLPKNEHIHTITEMGGGYGNMCRILYSHGYKNNYVIVDLPQMHSMQQHYLDHVLPSGTAGQKISFLKTIDNFSDHEAEAFLFGTFSVGEMPPSLREEIELHYKNYDYLFFAYNKMFDGVDNVKYFSELGQRLSSEFHCNFFKDPYRNTWFLLANKKK